MKQLLFLLLIAYVTIQCENSGIKYVEDYNKKDVQKITPLTNSWEKTIPFQTIPEGLTSISAKSCGVCHQDHYEEWKHSTHSHAWTDPQFQAEIAKETSPFMCINCHIPLENQQEYIVTGLINGDVYNPVKHKNPNFDKKLQQEGINCASCHVRNGAIIGPTGTSKAPHKTIKDTTHLSENLCISCHNAVATISPQLPCTFETGDEWKAGPYFGEKNCKTCHMPDTTRSIVSGFEPRKSHLHYFMGSGIPKFIDKPTKMLNGLQIKTLPFNKETKIGDSLSLRISLTNQFAGHKIPTGDPERFFLIEQKVYTKDSVLLFEKTHRIGEEWEWYPVAKKISDNNLLPKEERIFNLDIVIPSEEELIYKVIVTKNRATVENKEYNKLPEDYPIKITIFEEETLISNQ